MADGKQPVQPSRWAPRVRQEEPEEELEGAQREEQESFKGPEPAFADLKRPVEKAEHAEHEAVHVPAVRPAAHKQILDFLEEFRKATVNIVFAGIVGLLLLTVIKAIKADEMAVDPISLPKNFKDLGYTEEGLAQTLADKMRMIVQESRQNGSLLNAKTGGEESDIAVPVAGISFTTAIRLIRQIAGYPQRHVSGEMICTADPCTSKDLELRLRMTNGLSSTILIDPIKGASPDEVLKTGAEEVIRNEDMMSLAVHLYGNAPDDTARRDEAMTIASKFASEPGPDQAMAENLIGISFLDKPGDDKNDIATGILHFNAATAADSSFLLGYVNLALAQATLGQRADAIENYRTAIKLNQNYGKAHRGLASVLRDEGKMDEAISELNSAIAIDRNDGQSYNILASILKSQNKFEDARTYYLQAIRAEPNNADFVFNLGLAYKEHGDKPEAKQAFETYLEMSPNASDKDQVKTMIEELK